MRLNKLHIDKGEWATKPHRTHLCEFCGHKWRPEEYPTVGVAAEDKPIPDLSHLNVVGPHGETVGRIVHYVAHTRRRNTQIPRLFAAIVSCVYTDGTVDLRLFSTDENPKYATRTPFSPVLREGHWSWPAKT